MSGVHVSDRDQALATMRLIAKLIRPWSHTYALGLDSCSDHFWHHPQDNKLIIVMIIN